MENKDNEKFVFKKKWLIIGIICVIICIICVCVILAIQNSSGGDVCHDGKGCTLGIINLIKYII